ARGALQSGDLGYGLDRLQTQHAQDLYDLANQFTGEAQGYVNQYASTLQGLDQDQINAIRQAAADAYGMGYRLGAGATGGFSGSGGSFGGVELAGTVGGYSDEEIANAVNAYATAHGYKSDPTNGGRMGMVMQEGTITTDANGNPGIMVKYFDG